MTPADQIRAIAETLIDEELPKAGNAILAALDALEAEHAAILDAPLETDRADRLVWLTRDEAKMLREECDAWWEICRRGVPLRHPGRLPACVDLLDERIGDK